MRSTLSMSIPDSGSFNIEGDNSHILKVCDGGDPLVRHQTRQEGMLTSWIVSVCH